MTVNIEPTLHSEKMLLGALLLDGFLFESIKTMLSPDDFAIDAHRVVFKAITDVYRTVGAFDRGLVHEKGVISLDYLHQLAHDCFSTANIVSHAAIIREHSVHRHLEACAKEIDAQKNG